MDVDRAVLELYGLAPEEFTAVRKAPVQIQTSDPWPCTSTRTLCSSGWIGSFALLSEGWQQPERALDIQVALRLRATLS